jgi:hypothetical protein
VAAPMMALAERAKIVLRNMGFSFDLEDAA